MQKSTIIVVYKIWKTLNMQNNHHYWIWILFSPRNIFSFFIQTLAFTLCLFRFDWCFFKLEWHFVVTMTTYVLGWPRPQGFLHRRTEETYANGEIFLPFPHSVLMLSTIHHLDTAHSMSFTNIKGKHNRHYSYLKSNIFFCKKHPPAFTRRRSLWSNFFLICFFKSNKLSRVSDFVFSTIIKNTNMNRLYANFIFF